MNDEKKEMRITLSKSGLVNGGNAVMYTIPEWDRESAIRTISLLTNDLKAVWEGKIPSKIVVTITNGDI